MGGWAARRTARLFVQLTPKERAQLEALARRDGSTLTAAVVSLITREHAVAVAGGFLSPVAYPTAADIDHQLQVTGAAVRAVVSKKRRR